MRKTKLATYAVALTLAAAAMTGISTETAHAEEVTQVVATDTDAAVEDTTEVVTEEVVTEETTTEAEVVADEVTVADKGGDAYYNINENGGSWDGTHYTLNGQVITNAFFGDGTYTYYLQADGTPMKNRLTYHPDGEHVIFFDADGHEVFSNFANVKQSIAGEPVDDLCFFNTYGYMYVNKLTYDQSGQNLYYINEYGVMERGNKWFQFPDYIEDVSGDKTWVYQAYGFATENGALLTNTMTYNWNGQQVYLQGNGTMAKGLKNLGGTWYMFDVNDGHFVQTYDSKPETYTYTYYFDGFSDVTVYNKNDDWLTTDTYSSDGTHIYHYENTYDAAGVLKGYSYYGIDSENGTTSSGAYTCNSKGSVVSGEENFQYYDSNNELINVKYEYNALVYDSGNISYKKQVYYENGELAYICEYFYADTDDSRATATKISNYENGVLYNTNEYTYDSNGQQISWTEKYYDEAGNITNTYVH